MFNKIYEKIKEFIKNNWKFALVLIGIFLLFNIELPYIIYRPGGAIDLENRIIVENGYETDGKLQMAYVSVVKGSIPFVLASYVIPNWDLELKENVTYEDESIADMTKRDRIYLQQSIDNAIIEAYKLTGNTVKITREVNNVAYVTGEADTNLEIGDNLISVDGKRFENLDKFKAYINTKEVGEEVKILVNRGKNEKECYAKIIENAGEKLVGISIITTYEYETDPEIEIKSKASESGPSGGLMLALGIYNQLTKNDITKGRNIIGTGTISESGVVGEIGGVKYKLLGAINKKADIFICPNGANYEEAVKIKEQKKSNIKIIGVDTLEEAINELNK